MNPVKVGLLGLGVVGQGSANVLKRNAQEITRRAANEIVVKRAAVRDINKGRTLVDSAIELSDDPLSVVNDPEISIVVELMGGCEPARTLILQAIANGKHVVTANKA
ncbi:MAG: homoserine dehydrogenase, partial [Gammaproteobacteria bacterium]|nr:homoserine dehydrogenase [Gammaproteobacteria bacterium]